VDILRPGVTVYRALRSWRLASLVYCVEAQNRTRTHQEMR